jgi:hypothetical protein
MMIAEIASGHTDASDLLLLIAVILFAVAAIVAFETKSLWSGLVSLGLATVSLGWLLL